MHGALVSSVVEEYDFVFCYMGILQMSNICGLARYFLERLFPSFLAQFYGDQESVAIVY
jgi:hypothetical protein